MSLTADVTRAVRASSAQDQPTTSRHRRDLLTRLSQLEAVAAGSVVAPRFGSPACRPAESPAPALSASAITAACLDRLAVAPDEHRELGGLIAELHEIGAAVHASERDRRAHRLRACRAVIDRLRPRPLAELPEAVCAEVVHALGFDRASVLYDDDGTWAVRATVADERVGLPARRPVGPDAGDAADDRGLTVPLPLAGNVLGLLHVERSAGPPDALDRAVLPVLADAFARLYERGVHQERLRAQRHRVLNTLARAERDASALCASVDDLAPGHPGGDDDERPASPPGDRTVHLDHLTPRQIEVLRLMVGGATNGTIAATLQITEGTVKSHVKRILRKLRAVNRAQAISEVLGAPAVAAERTGATPGPP